MPRSWPPTQPSAPETPPESRRREPSWRAAITRSRPGRLLGPEPAAAERDAGRGRSFLLALERHVRRGPAAQRLAARTRQAARLGDVPARFPALSHERRPAGHLLCAADGASRRALRPRPRPGRLDRAARYRRRLPPDGAIPARSGRVRRARRLAQGPNCHGAESLTRRAQCAWPVGRDSRIQRPVVGAARAGVEPHAGQSTCGPLRWARAGAPGRHRSGSGRCPSRSGLRVALAGGLGGLGVGADRPAGDATPAAAGCDITSAVPRPPRCALARASRSRTRRWPGRSGRRCA